MIRVDLYPSSSDTDRTADLQSALDTCYEAGGGVVNLNPPGTVDPKLKFPTR